MMKFNYSLKFSAFLLFVTFNFLFITVAQSAIIKVASFNVLAPSWAAPNLYPASCSDLLPTGPRVQRIIGFMNQNILDLDAIALQETETTTNSALASGLGHNYYYFSANHNDQYWASFITVDPPFHSNGVAIAVNKKIYDSCTFVDRPLSNDGNHSAIAICHHKTLNRWFRFVSVHFDSDTGGRRGGEANALADYLNIENEHPRYVDFVMGDFNADTDSGVIKSRLTDAGYTDVLRAIGAEGQTHPWTSSYNRNSQWGFIDHLMVRGEGTQPLSGKIYDSDLYTLYPVITGQHGIDNENTRICLNLRYTGSDHFPISGTISVSP